MGAWTVRKPVAGRSYLMMRRTLDAQGRRWHGWIYNPSGWSQLVACGWVRAVEAVEDDPRRGRMPPLSKVPSEVKN